MSLNENLQQDLDADYPIYPIDLDAHGLPLPRHRRRSRAWADLPLTHYFVGCCKKEAKYSKMDGSADGNVEDGREQSELSMMSTRSVREKKAEDTLTAEKCLDATVDKIVGNLSWVNATLLAAAMKNTLQITFPKKDAEHAAASNAWIYFFIIFAVGIILAVVPRIFEDLAEMKRELALKSEETKDTSEEETAKQKAEKAELAKQQAEEPLNLKQASVKVYQFVEAEAGSLVEKFEDLFVDTLSNTVSMSWRDAAKATFALMISSDSATATAYFFYAVFMTTFGIYLVIRIGTVFASKQKAIIDYLEHFGTKVNPGAAAEEKRLLLRFAFVKRSIKLTQSVVKFAIAWSWRDSINAFILAIYGGTGSNVVAQQWGYFFSIALFVSLALSFSEQFYILYPKNASPKEQKAYLKDESRLIVNSVIEDNLRFVVGMALFDALIKSMAAIGKGDTVSNGVLCFLYWVVAVGGITLSLVGTHYCERWGLRKKISDKGAAQAMFDTFERFYDPRCLLHEEGDSDFVPMILDTTIFELVYVTVNGLGIAGSMSTTNAVTFTINSISAGSGYYDLNDPHSTQVNGNWAIWVSFLICLGISTLIVGYFARMVESARKARRDLFGKWRKKDEQQTGFDQKADRYVYGNETRRTTSKRKTKFSTKAEDSALVTSLIDDISDDDDDDDVSDLDHDANDANDANDAADDGDDDGNDGNDGGDGDDGDDGGDVGDGGDDGGGDGGGGDGGAGHQ